MFKKTQLYYSNFAAVAFCCLSVLNLVAAASRADILEENDSILFVSHRFILLSLAAIELSVSAIILISEKLSSRLNMITWLAVNLMIYRAMLWWLNEVDFSNCLGNLYDWFVFTPRQMTIVTNFLLLVIMVGGSFFLAYNFMKSRARKPAEISEATPARVET